jgi:hypothetical protein
MKDLIDMPGKSGSDPYFHPNRMGMVVLLAMEEILGQGGVKTVLNPADLPVYINDHLPNNQDPALSHPHISHLQARLENAYGSRAGRGLALRVGRASLRYGLREFGTELGLNELSFRLLPLQTKLKKTSEACAGLFNTYTDQQVRLENEEKFIFWHIQRCPLNRERQAESLGCNLAVGLLQEALFWVSGGKQFDVEEKKCIEGGDKECLVVIDRSPRF